MADITVGDMLDRAEDFERRLQACYADARDRVVHGSTLTDALGRSDLMPSLVMRMLAVGESSGVLDESLDRVAVYYDREVPAVVSKAVAMFNTAALLMLGGTLVTIALSIFGPMYQMMGSLSAQ